MVVDFEYGCMKCKFYISKYAKIGYILVLHPWTAKLSVTRNLRVQIDMTFLHPAQQVGGPTLHNLSLVLSHSGAAIFRYIFRNVDVTELAAAAISLVHAASTSAQL